MTSIETKKRSWLKAISYRIFGTLVSITTVYFLTGEYSLALSAGLLDVSSKILLYYLHERGWNLVQWGKANRPSAIIWFTGLSGAGKSALAEKVSQHFLTKKFQVELLDGDTIRADMKNHGFSREERLRHLKLMGFIASKLYKQHTLVIGSFITPYEEARRHLREICPNYIEIWVDTPLEVCEQRDVKGLYAKSRRGEIQSFTGISDPFETPEKFDIRVTTELPLEETAQNLIQELERRLSDLKKES